MESYSYFAINYIVENNWHYVSISFYMLLHARCLDNQLFELNSFLFI